MVHPAVEETVKKIRSLEIQGASNVAERALAAIYTMLADSEGASTEELKEMILEAVEALAKSRPTEPALREALAFVLRTVKEKEDLPGGIFREALMDAIDRFVDIREELVKRIGEIGSSLIDDGMTILTHCHSSTLMEVFRRAAEEREFTVIVTETRPRYQGKITARELLQMGVRVIYIVDSAAYYFMRKADLYMTGADVVTADARVVNKIGTALMALAAHEFGVPYYVTVTSLKFDPATILGLREPIEERDPSEVIDPSELPGAEIRNPAFDITPPHLISGIISEKGVLNPFSFVSLMASQRTVDPELERVIKLSIFQ